MSKTFVRPLHLEITEIDLGRQAGLCFETSKGEF